jgi:hypothetical protein
LATEAIGGGRVHLVGACARLAKAVAVIARALLSGFECDADRGCDEKRPIDGGSEPDVRAAGFEHDAHSGGAARSSLALVDDSSPRRLPPDRPNAAATSTAASNQLAPAPSLQCLLQCLDTLAMSWMVINCQNIPVAFGAEIAS